MQRIIIPAIALALLLTGCSNTTEEPPQDESATKQTQAPAEQKETTEETPEEQVPAEATIESVLEQLGASGYEQSSSPAPYAAEYGKATYEGTEIQLYAFASDEDYQSFLESVKDFGIVESQLAMKDLVVVAPKDQTKLASIRTALGV